ncbi:hypothetical protein EV715DRAFT_295632 [Schizophyllum commune]
MWTTSQPAATAPNSAGPTVPAPTSSVSNEPTGPASAPSQAASATQRIPMETVTVRVPIRDTVDADDTDELDWETDEEVDDDDVKDPDYDPNEDSDLGTDDSHSDDQHSLHSQSAGSASKASIERDATPSRSVTAEDPSTTSEPLNIVNARGPEVAPRSPVTHKAPKWDTSSAKGSDRHTISDKKALRRYPDFCIVHAISEYMRELLDDGGMDEARRQKYTQLRELWASRRTSHRCLLLIEEDKRGASRRTGCNADRQTVHASLTEAIAQLVKYVSAYFYAVPDSPGVIIRPTAGMWWQKLFVTPAEAPAFDPVTGTTASDPHNRSLRKEIANRFGRLPLYRVNTDESDKALTEMREDMLQLARDCEAAHPPKATR